MGRFLRRSLSATFALGLLFVSAPPQSVAAVDPYNATAQPTQINTMFMNSAPHRANILGNFTLVATAWRVASNGYGYVAEEFLNAPAAVPDPFRAMLTIDAFGGVHGDGGTLPQAVTSYWPNWR